MALHVIDAQLASHRIRNGCDMTTVRRDDAVTAPECTLDDCDINNVVVMSSSGEYADVLCDPLRHRLDVAGRQHAGQPGLSSAPTPCLSEHGCRNHWHHRLGEKTSMDCPHAPVVPLGGDQRPRVVGDSVNHWASVFSSKGGRPSSARARARPRASSSNVRAPFSASHSARPCQPASRRRRWLAASASQALTVVPSASAAASTASEIPGGSEIDRLCRCATTKW
jgi:hypothetical protein